MNRRSVFERLGPCNLGGDEMVSMMPAQPPAPGLTRRPALDHPLVARQLRVAQCCQSETKCGSNAPPSSITGHTKQQLQRDVKQRERRAPQQQHHSMQARTWRGNAAATQPSVQGWVQRGFQLASSSSSAVQAAAGGRDAAALQGRLHRLQAERDAADELLAQMVQQTQALLAEKQALQRQAALLAVDKARLEEQLDFLQAYEPGGEVRRCSGVGGARRACLGHEPVARRCRKTRPALGRLLGSLPACQPAKHQPVLAQRLQACLGSQLPSVPGAPAGRGVDCRLCRGR